MGTEMHRELLDAVHRRPDMYGLDGRYATAAAFVTGYNAATQGSLLEGFLEWLQVRLGHVSNLAWPVLVEQLASGDSEQDRIDALFTLLDEFLAERESSSSSDPGIPEPHRRDGDQIREYLLRQLNSALRRPGTYGDESSLLLLLDALAFADDMAEQWDLRHQELSDRAASNSGGVKGAALKVLPRGCADSVMSSVYATLAHRLGWLRADRLPPADDHRRMRDGIDAWCREDRTLGDVVATYGPPSVHIGGTNPYYPKSFVYVSEDPEVAPLSLHLWNEIGPTAGDEITSAFPEPVLLAYSIEKGRFGYTPEGAKRRPRPDDDESEAVTRSIPSTDIEWTAEATMTTNQTGEVGDHSYTVSRVVDAPVDRVWQAWTRPEQYEKWFGAVPGSVELDVRPGGTWRATMPGDETMTGSYGEVVERQRLVHLTDWPGREPSVMDFRFAEVAGGTRIEVSQTCGSAEERDGAKAGAEMLLQWCADYLASNDTA